MNRVLFFIAVILIVSCKYADSNIKQVTILDSEFQIVRIIESESQILELKKHWASFESINELPNSDWTHKIDIDSDSKLGGRWLYNSKGFVARLNKQLDPKFKVSDVKKLNMLLLRVDS